MVGGKYTQLRAGLAGVAMLSSILLLASCQQDNSGMGTGEVEPVTARAESFAEVFAGAMQAMGMTGVTRLEYAANGWEACLGQPWNINEGWARWSITDYNRVIDYGSFNSYQTAQRQAGMDTGRLGGCGAQPDAAAQNQRASVNSESPWPQQLQVHLTPAGFLLLAQAQGASIQNDGDNISVTVNTVASDGIQYRLVGSYGEDLLLDHVITWIDDSVYGDMAFEAQFSDYRDFSGIQFPSHIVQKQGGYATLDLDISSVTPNTLANAQPPAGGPGGFGGGQQPDLPAWEAIGEGIYALHGGYQSVVMEFDEFSVVLDGLQNDSRVREIIAITRELIPDKPIGYVFSTHAHFDHASGLRQFVAAGATIITQAANVDFFASALAMPRTLNPDAVDTTGLPVNIVGVEDFYAIDDGTQRVEFYKLDGSTHADDAMIAYIPSLSTIVEADLLQPWINPVFGGGDHPFLIWFADELARLGLDYEQFVPVHRPSNPPLMSRNDLLEAVGY